MLRLWVIPRKVVASLSNLALWEVQTEQVVKLCQQDMHIARDVERKLFAAIS